MGESPSWLAVVACCWFRSTAHDQSPVPPHNLVGEHHLKATQARQATQKRQGNKQTSKQANKRLWQHQARVFSSLFFLDWHPLHWLASGAHWANGHALQAVSLLDRPVASALTKVNASAASARSA